ncbi:hypothetical protein [Shimia sp.]|uniref:hypothetical protein n=1 Tax=Shimia sp. TaxID=1954381 RepID=UPI00329821E3
MIYPDLLSPDANHITLFYANAMHLHDFVVDYGLTSLDDITRFRDQLSNVIAKQVRNAPKGAHTMLMSSENLTGNLVSPVGVTRLQELLAPHFDEIEILVYVRRQDDAILSMYGEFMRRGFSGRPFELYLNKALGPQSQTPYLYYRRTLTKWIDAFGRDAITVRKFDRSNLIGGDILTDFMTQVLGLDEAPDLSGLVRSEDDNVGLSAPVMEFLRQMYPTFSSRKDDEYNPLRDFVEPIIATLPSSPRPRMSSAQSQRIMTTFNPANTWLKETFFPEVEEPLFPPRDETDAFGNLGHITLEEFAELAGKFIR